MGNKTAKCNLHMNSNEETLYIIFIIIHLLLYTLYTQECILLYTLFHGAVSSPGRICLKMFSSV